MRKLGFLMIAAGLVSTPAIAFGDDKTSPTKAEREAAEEREQARKCKQRRDDAKAKCKPSVRTSGETPSAGPIDRAYNAPFF